MGYKIAVIPGDGIGPEITAQAIKVLNAVSSVFGCEFEIKEVPVGGCAIDLCGEPLPKESLDICKSADAVLLGAVGGPKWDKVSADKRPEKALLGLRKELELFANLRPATLMNELKGASPLKEEVIGEGLNFVVVRELTGGIYFGEKAAREDYAYDVEKYHVYEIERIARVAFNLAMNRKKILHSVDKANVLESSRLWRSVVERISAEFPEVSVTHLYVDNAAMQIATNPKQFDVILTNNIFGDILSDLSATITGSLGMLPSSSMGVGSTGMYEPIHGSAPDIAGKNVANPIATILSVAMLLELSLGLKEAAEAVREAVNSVIGRGYRTADIMSKGMTAVGCLEMGNLIADEIKGSGK